MQTSRHFTRIDATRLGWPLVLLVGVSAAACQRATSSTEPGASASASASAAEGAAPPLEERLVPLLELPGLKGGMLSLLPSGREDEGARLRPKTQCCAESTVQISVQGAGPASVDELLATLREGQKAVTRLSGEPHLGLTIAHTGSELVATSAWDAQRQRFTSRVGLRGLLDSVVIDDPTDFTVWATNESVLSLMSEQLTCKGELENRGQTPMDVVVECGPLDPETMGTPVTDLAARRSQLSPEFQKRILDLGRLMPGDRKKYAFPAGKGKSMVLRVYVDGKPVDHLDATGNDDRKAWIELLLEADRRWGLAHHFEDKHSGPLMMFTATERFEALPVADKKAASAALWPLVRDHLTKHHHVGHLAGYMPILAFGKDKDYTLDGGKFTEKAKEAP